MPTYRLISEDLTGIAIETIAISDWSQSEPTDFRASLVFVSEFQE